MTWKRLLHEAGHAFHALAAREQHFYAYRGAPIEFCEVASMGMELLGNALNEFYPDGKILRRETRPATILRVLSGFFPWIATVDAFEHWIYTHPDHTARTRPAWLAFMDRFGGNEDWNGYEAARANLWHRQLHILCTRFITSNTALRSLARCRSGQIQSATRRRRWVITKRPWRSRLASIAGIVPGSGLKFEFSAKTIQPIAKMLREELENL